MKQTLAGFSILFLAAVGIALLASVAFAGAPTGGSPLDALMVPTDWQTIAPNASLWFYFDYWLDTAGPAPRARSSAPTRSKVDVIVDANHFEAIQFAIYTPALAQDWLRESTTLPIGRGTTYRDTRTGFIVHDLYWSGAFNVAGRYFIRVTNNAPFALPFRLTVTGDTITLYPTPTVTPTPTIPFAVTRIPTSTLSGKIVFQQATGGVIYSVNGDGSNLTVISSGLDPAWSPDGKQIAFARWDSVYPGLYVANADGSAECLIYGAPRIRAPRWSPDGKFIAFTQDKPSKDGKPLWKLGVVELPRVKTDPTQVEPAKLIEPQCSRLCFTPSWSADGKQLAYNDPGEGIMATNVISGSASFVLAPSGTYFDAGANMPRPILHLPPIQSSLWSPDGRRIAYAEKSHDRWELHTINADGTNATGITSPNPILYTFFRVIVNNVAPAWSPDSKQLLFLSDRNGKWEFFVADADGLNIRQVLKGVTDVIPLRFDFENERMMDWAR
jgi:TolB protein